MVVVLEGFWRRVQGNGFMSDCGAWGLTVLVVRWVAESWRWIVGGFGAVWVGSVAILTGNGRRMRWFEAIRCCDA
jgi:hypothetical protein